MGNISGQVDLQIEKAIKILKDGGVIAFPTDTVYGLGGDAFDIAVAERIYRLKRRSRDLPLPVLLADLTQITSVAESVSEIAWFLMKHFWPGALTLVLPKRASLPDIVTAGGSKVAVRVPAHLVPISIIRGLGKPIIGTSANISNSPSPVMAEEVRRQFGSQVDLVIDTGKCSGGMESTVVDATAKMPVILRQGIIPEKDIEKAYQEYIKEVNKSAYSSGL